MKEIYVIYKLWIDTLENRNAYGFDEIGFVESKEKAEEICNSEWVKKSDYPWPLDYAFEFEGDKVPRYTYLKLKLLDEVQ